MLRAVPHIIHRHLPVFVSSLLLWQEVVVHLQARSIVWILVMVDLDEFLVAADEDIFVDLVVTHKFIDEGWAAFVNVVYCACRYELFVLSELEAAKAVLGTILTQYEDVVLISENFYDIVRILSENQFFLVEASSSIIDCKQSYVISAVLLNDEIIAIYGRYRFDLEPVGFYDWYRFLCMSEYERQILPLLYQHSLKDLKA